MRQPNAFLTPRSTAALLAVAATWLLATTAQAQTTFQLRKLEISTSVQGPQIVGSQSDDSFNNGNPLSGLVHQPLLNGNPNGAPVTGGYTQFGTFSPGRELSGPASDFLGGFGIGSLAFARADAAINNTNLTPAEASVSTLTLRTAAPSGTSLGLVARNSGFSFFNAINYSAMLPGEVFQIAVNGSGGANYVDRLQIRYGTAFATGLPFINFETQSSNAGVLTRTVLGSTTPANLYGNLPGVAYIGLALNRAMPTAANLNPGVQASVILFAAALNGTGDDLQELANYTFPTSGLTFQGSGDSQSVFSAATWTTAVPEPGSAALLALGMAGLLIRRAGLKARAARPCQ